MFFISGECPPRAIGAGSPPTDKVVGFADPPDGAPCPRPWLASCLGARAPTSPGSRSKPEPETATPRQRGETTLVPEARRMNFKAWRMRTLALGLSGYASFVGRDSTLKDNGSMVDSQATGGN